MSLDIKCIVSICTVQSICTVSSVSVVEGFDGFWIISYIHNNPTEE